MMSSNNLPDSASPTRIAKYIGYFDSPFSPSLPSFISGLSFGSKMLLPVLLSALSLLLYFLFEIFL
jgi:hypothetical protein